MIRHRPRLGLTFCLALQTHRAARGWVSIPVEMGLVIVAVAAAAAAEAEAMKAPTVLAVGVDSGAMQLRSKTLTGHWSVRVGMCHASCPQWRK